MRVRVGWWHLSGQWHSIPDALARATRIHFKSETVPMNSFGLEVVPTGLVLFETVT